MKISVIQSQKYPVAGAGQPGRWNRPAAEASRDRTVNEAFEMMAAAGSVGANLVVTIECLNQMCDGTCSAAEHLRETEPLDGPLIARFADLTRRFGMYAVAGLLTRRDGLAYNSAVLFGPDGNIRGIFDKVHLPAGEDRHITPGSSYPVFATEFGNLGMLVCWDMQYPEAARELALGGADLIACPTWGWENLSGLCRAYENSVTIAAAMGVYIDGEVFSICDPSCVVDNLGRIVTTASRHGPQIATAEIDICAEPAPQYGSGEVTGMTSMRQIRLSQRRPETYTRIGAARPPLAARYRTLTPIYREERR